MCGPPRRRGTAVATGLLDVVAGPEGMGVGMKSVIVVSVMTFVLIFGGVAFISHQVGSDHGADPEMAAERLELERMNNPVDIGVRVEAPAPVMEPLTESLYESKLYFNTPSFDDQVRTFCMHAGGKEILQKLYDKYTNGKVHVVGCGPYAKEAFVSTIPINTVADMKGVKVKTAADDTGGAVLRPSYIVTK